MNPNRTLAIVTAFMVISVVAVPAALAADDSLSVDVDQQSESGEALVTVTHNDTAVENATVQVNASGNYSANDTYQTDENGTVALPNPDESVDVNLTVTDGETTVNESVTLVPLSESLSVSVEQNEDDSPTVTVTQYDEPVDNATVNVTLDDENATYAGADGEYATNADGEVDLPTPTETVDVSVTATSGELTAETTATLTVTEAGLEVSAWQASDGHLAIEVTHNDEPADADVTVTPVDGTYSHEGTYTATNGTLDLPGPAENVTVDVTAAYDNETASTVVDLETATEAAPNNEFARSLGTYIQFLKTQATDGPIGQKIAAFAQANNPSNDRANGPPAHVSDGDENSSVGEPGPPDHANANQTHNGSEDAGDRGPPEGVPGNGGPGNGGPADNGDSDDDDMTSNGQSQKGPNGQSQNGPPAHANAP